MDDTSLVVMLLLPIAQKAEIKIVPGKPGFIRFVLGGKIDCL